MNIRKKTTIMILAVGIVTALISGAIALYGMFALRDTAMESEEDMIHDASESSSELLVELSKEYLKLFALKESNDFNKRLLQMTDELEELAAQATEINSQPGNFLPQDISTPNENNCRSGQMNFYARYAPNVSENSLANDVSLMANLENSLVRTVQKIPFFDTIIVASREGFELVLDNEQNTPPEKFVMPLKTFDHFQVDWYRKAMEEGKTVFIDARETLNNDGDYWLFFFSTPYYNAAGEVDGVIAGSGRLENLNTWLKDLDLPEYTSYYVLDRHCRILLFSETEADSQVGADDDTWAIMKDLREGGDEEISAIFAKILEERSGILNSTYEDIEYYGAYEPIETTDWIFIASVRSSDLLGAIEENNKSMSEIAQKRLLEMNNITQTTIALFAICIFILLALVVYSGKKLSARFVEPIHELADGVREITSGNLDKKLAIDTGDEIEHLAVCFNAMTDELKIQMADLAKVTADKERIATELNVATKIQADMLPRNFDFGRKDFELYATMNPAKEVGGDFYDFYMLDENHLAITIADVSGKGVPAALFMVISKTILKNLALMATTPDDYAAVMTNANLQLCQGNAEKMFVTTFFGVLDLQSGEFNYVNGGHNAPLVYHKDTGFEYLQMPKSCMLGVRKKVPFNQRSVKLNAGDMLFLYTDGVTEAMNERGEEFSTGHLRDVLNAEDKTESLKVLLANVRQSIKMHAGAAEQSDDITMVAVRFQRETEN